MGIAVFGAIALFAALCSVLSLLCSVYVVAKQLGIENTKWNVVPINQDTSGLEELEKKIQEATERSNIKYGGLAPSGDLEDLV